MSALVPCPGCNRHVKSDEATCPFCQAAMAPGARSGRCARPFPSRLASAALVAAGAALLGPPARTAIRRLFRMEYRPPSTPGARRQQQRADRRRADALPDAKK